MEHEIKKNRTFDIIYLDPPWDLPFVRDHYGVLTPLKLKNLPIDQISNKKTILFMWVVTNKLVEAIELMNHWGFYYVDTAFVWVKTTVNTKLHFGLGKTSTRRGSEFVLMGVRYGSPIPERKSKSIPQVVVDQIREPFSRKPDLIRKYISDLFDHNSKIELFARKFPDSKFTEGWTLYNRGVIQNTETEKKKKKRRVDTHVPAAGKGFGGSFGTDPLSLPQKKAKPRSLFQNVESREKGQEGKKGEEGEEGDCS